MNHLPDEDDIEEILTLSESTNNDVELMDDEIEEPTPTPSKRKKNYLNNADMLIEVKKSLQQGKMTDKLAHMMILLTNRYGTQPKFSGYSFLDDMKSYATYMICRTWNRFNPERGVNVFAFFTQCIKHSFYQYLNKEKHQRNIRDKLLISSGLNPSNTFMVDYESERGDYNNDDYYNDNSYFSDNLIIEQPTQYDESSSEFGEPNYDELTNYDYQNTPSENVVDQSNPTTN